MDWFEVISENHMVDGGSPLHHLDRLCEHYPVVQHGVSMSIGGREDPEHTARLVALAKRSGTPWVSDHVCFTGSDSVNAHDLLPVPYTPQMLQAMVERAKRMQGVLPVPFALENPSSYLSFRASVMPEWEFMSRLVEQADIGWMLDVNNIYVSSINHGFDPMTYLENVPADRVVQIHLAGHSIMDGYRLDTHDAPVCDAVWDLYRAAIERIGPVSTLVEWDGNIPSWERLSEEAAHARRVRDQATAVWQASHGP